MENSEYLSDLLKERGVPHNVLNARPKVQYINSVLARFLKFMLAILIFFFPVAAVQYAAREAEIIAQAGRKYAVTISTNMAGRGTDVILGGNPKVCKRSFFLQRFPSLVCPGFTLCSLAGVGKTNYTGQCAIFSDPRNALR